MEKKKKSVWSLLNPLEWLNAALQLLAAVFGPLLRWLGMLTPPSTTGFANTQVSDVEDAERLAKEQEAAVDALNRKMSPAEVVKAFASASPEERAAMNLSALEVEEQDWLLRLSDEDLSKLSMSTTNGCERSLEAKEVLPSYAKQKQKPEMRPAEILKTPTEEEIQRATMDFISASYRELFHAPGVPNANPRYIPTTLH